MIALNKLHLAYALVVMMMIAQHFVNNNYHINETRNRRSAMNRKQKNVKRETERSRITLEDADERREKQ